MLIKCVCGGIYNREQEQMMCDVIVKVKRCCQCLRMIPNEHVSQEVRSGFKIYLSVFNPEIDEMADQSIADLETEEDDWYDYEYEDEFDKVWYEG